MRRPDERSEIVDGHDRGKASPRRQRELSRVIDVDPLARQFEREQHRIKREHRELRPPQPRRGDVVVRRQEAGIGGGEVPQSEQCPFDVSRRPSRECREEVPRVATDASNPRHRLQMSGVDGQTHRS